MRARFVAELIGVLAVAAGAALWQPALGPVVVGAYLVYWANAGGE